MGTSLDELKKVIEGATWEAITPQYGWVYHKKQVFLGKLRILHAETGRLIGSKDKIEPLWFGHVNNLKIKPQETEEEVIRLIDSVISQSISDFKLNVGEKNGYHRARLYQQISEKLGYEYHTAEIRSVEDARKVYAIIQGILKEAA